ncbi:MAG: glycosyltransferase family 39 protein [Candidatus Omnitrophica bacterium]|nr:glycosyltransferase family 39 protein [Candidatus Omnitrophota bacterium]
MQSIILKVLDLIGLFVLSVFAFVLSFKAGERGFFAFDQSIFFDGAYRILCGQIPFKDFSSTVGPITFWLHAIPFKLFGVSYFSYLLGAAVINSLAALIVVAILRLFFPRRPFLSYLGGVLTAICFYPPFGTPCYEQSAMFFVLLTILLLVLVIFDKRLNPVAGYSLLFIAGIFMTASFLSKQNIGFIYPVYFLLLLLSGSERKWQNVQRVIVFFCGSLFSSAVFLWWLWQYSDLKTFWNSFVVLTARLGSGRLDICTGKYLALVNVGSPELQNIMHIAFGLSILGLAFYLIIPKIRNIHSSRVFLAGVLCLYGISFQYFFIDTTLNESEVASSLAALIFVLGVGVFYVAWRDLAGYLEAKGGKQLKARMDLVKWIVTAVIIVFACRFAWHEIEVALKRSVHGFSGSTEFSDYMRIERLKNLQWGHPTTLRGTEIKENDFTGLYEYLKKKDCNFFIFPDNTILYGLLGKPSPQPLLWFHIGATFPVLNHADIDQKIVSDLEKNKVKIVVVEKVSFLNTKLEYFPRLKKYISDNFIKMQEIGIFGIFEKR